MVVVGIILFVLGCCGIARIITLPLGCLLIIIGVLMDVLHFIGHTVALVF